MLSRFESYDTLKQENTFILVDANDILEHKSITINGQVIDLDFVLQRADYKVKQIFNLCNFTANSTYACVFCTIFKTET